MVNTSHVYRFFIQSLRSYIYFVRPSYKRKKRLSLPLIADETLTLRMRPWQKR